MRQTTLSDTGFDKYNKKTRKERFLDDMDKIIPWKELTEAIEPFYPKPKGAGRRPIGIERMLRIHFLQHWFNLSDPAAEEALYDSLAMRRFVGIDLGREPAPDETTICKFRHLMERHQPGRSPVRPGQCLPGRERAEGEPGHDRGCQHHRRTEFDEEPEEGTGPGDALHAQGQAVVLRHEGAYRGGQSQQADPFGGGHAGECPRLPGSAGPAAW